MFIWSACKKFFRTFGRRSSLTHARRQHILHRQRRTFLEPLEARQLMAGLPPAIGNLSSTPAAYNEHDWLVSLPTSSATITDSDSTNFAGGSLTAAIIDSPTNGADVLWMKWGGTLPVSIEQTPVANTLVYNATNIGSLSGGSNGTPLTALLNVNATPTAAAAILRQLAYRNSGDDPGTPLTRTIRFQVTDNNGNLSNTPTVGVNVNPENDAPTIASAAGEVTWTEGAGAIAIMPDALVRDPDSAALATLGVKHMATVGGSDRIDVPNQGTGAGQIGTANVSGSTLYSGNVTYGGVTIGSFVNAGFTQNNELSFTFNSSASVPAVQALVRALTFNNTNTSGPTATDRVIRFTLSDGSLGGTVEQTVNINLTNDAPVNSVPGQQTVSEDGAKVFNAANGNLISIADVDAGTAAVQVSLGVAHGTLALSAVTGLTFSSGSNNSAAMTFTGTITSINAALNGLIYRPSANYNGSETLTITTNDLGNTGSDGAQSDTDSMPVSVTSVNDVPAIAGVSGTANYTEDGWLVTLPLGSATVSDADNTNFDGGWLKAEITGNADPGDVLGVRWGGSSGFVVSGSTITYNSNVIGTMSGGTELAPLIITLTSYATHTSTAALLGQIGFRHAGEDPGNVTRTISFTLNDGQAGSNSPTVSVTVTPLPDAVADSYALPVTAMFQTSAGEGVLANDDNPNGTLTAEIVTQPAHGIVTLSANGSFEYTPTSGYIGPDSFTYWAKEGSAPRTTETTGTVQLSVGEGHGAAFGNAPFWILGTAALEKDPGGFWLGRNGNTSDSGSIEYYLSGEVDAVDFIEPVTVPWQTASFAAGESETWVSFEHYNDRLNEPDEHYSISGRATGNASSSASGSGTIYASDNSSVSIVQSDGSAHEEGQDPGAFRLYRGGDLSEEVTVEFHLPTDGGQATSDDYTLEDGEGQSLSNSVTFPADIDTVYIIVKPVDDALAEGMERVDIVLDEPSANAANFYMLGNPTLAELTLNDNDIANQAPVGVADGPYMLTGEDTAFAMDVLMNDYDPDNYPSALSGIIGSVPDPGTDGVLQRQDGTSLNVGDSFTGSVVFVPLATWEDVTQFSYRPFDGLAAGNVVFVALERPKLDIKIWNGGPGGLLVEDGKEEEPGAFTVANWNDTDGDGVVDNGDSDGVIASTTGRDEVDLIHILIMAPRNYDGGAVTLTLDSGSAAFWKDEQKLEPLVPAQIDDWGPSDFFRSVYMEVTAPSLAVRDIHVTVGYKGQTTGFKATGVWSNVKAVAHDQLTYAELVALPAFAAMHLNAEFRHTAPKAMASNVDGTGLKHVPDAASMSDAFRNGIAFAFELTPPKIEKELVFFDITRRVERRSWFKKDGVGTPIGHDHFPSQVEEANDDPDNVDESFGPDSANRMYSFDAPGNRGIARFPTGGENYYNHDLNAEEFVRVSFSGKGPKGDGVQGTQASFKQKWHANTFVAYSIPADEWYRSTADGTADGPAESTFNRIGEEHQPLTAP